MRIGKKYVRRDESGQTLVELALTLPLLLLLLLGGAELARLAYAAIEVTNAAKAAVQYGDQSSGNAADCSSTGSGTCSTNSGMYIAANDDAANLPNPVTVTETSQFQCSNAPGTLITVTNTSCPGEQIEQIITVTTSTTFDPLIHVPGLPTTYTITGQATQMVLPN